MASQDLLDAWRAHVRAFETEHQVTIRLTYPEIVLLMANAMGVTGIVPPYPEIIPLPREEPQP